MDKLNNLITRAESLINKLENLLPAINSPIDWQASALRWLMQNNKGHLQVIAHPHQISLANIHFVDDAAKVCGLHRQQEGGHRR